MTMPHFFSISLRSTGAKALLGLSAVMCVALLVPSSAKAQSCLECVWYYSEYDDPMADCLVTFSGGNWCMLRTDFRDCASGRGCWELAQLDFSEDGTAYRRAGDDPFMRDGEGRPLRDRNVERTCDGVLLGTRLAARRPSPTDGGMANGRNVLFALEL